MPPNPNGLVHPHPSKWQLTVAFVICYVSLMFSGVSSMLMSVYLPLVAGSLLGKATGEKFNNVSSYINSAFIFGSMFGGFAWGFICDKIGRSKSVIFSTGMYGFFTVLTAFTASWVLVALDRFLTGFGVGGVLVTTNILVAELWPEKRRSIVLGIVSAAMPVGFILAGAMNNLLPDWHQGFLTGLIPVATAVAGLFWLHDSANWKENKMNPSSVAASVTGLFASVYKPALLQGSIIFGTMLIGLWSVFSWAPTWITGIAPNPAEAGNLRGLTMMILATTGLFGSMASGWIANWIGLRKTMMLCFGACFAMTFVVFKMNTAVSQALFLQMGVLAFFFGISQGALSVYIPALFPTVIRATATGFCFNIGRLFTATVVFFIGALVNLLGGYGNAVFIFSFIFLAGLAASFFSKDKAVPAPVAVTPALIE